MTAVVFKKININQFIALNPNGVSVIENGIRNRRQKSFIVLSYCI